MSNEIKQLEAVYPLTPLQEGMLFHAVEAREAGRDVVQVSGRLADGVTPEALREAVQRAVTNHAILRTGYVWRETERSLQAVMKQATLPYTDKDVHHLPMARAQALAGRRRAARRRLGFDLSRPPPVALDLIRMPDSFTHACLTFHHIALDGWSFAAVLAEITEDAIALSQNRTLPPRPRRKPFRAFIDWLSRQDEAAGEEFWKDYLRGAEGQVLLDPARRRQDLRPGHRPNYMSHAMALTRSEMDGFRAACVRLGVTPATIATAAWALVVARRSGGDTALFGVTVSGRPYDLAGADEILGMMIATLPMYERLGQSLRVADWLVALQKRAADARAYGYLPLSSITRAAGLDRDFLDFDSVFVFENFPDAGVGDQALFAGVVETREQTGFPITITAMLANNRLEAVLDVDAALVVQEEAEQLLNQFRCALTLLVQSDERYIGALDLLSTVEKERRLRAACGPKRPIAQLDLGRALRSAAAVPDRVAVLAGDGQITYGDLYRRAEAMAVHLRSAGLRLDDPVGVFLERGIDHAVAVAAVLAAGGCYVPLDTNWPDQRLAQAAQAARITACIYSGERAAPTGPWTPVKVAPPDEAVPPKDRSLAPEDHDPLALGYMAFTSGTSGAPKAVMNERLGLANHLQMMTEVLDLGAQDVVAQTASVSFDVSVWQLLAPLTIGARVAVLDDVTANDAASLAEALEEHGVTILQTTPSVLETLIQLPCPSFLRSLCVTGDVLHPKLAQKVVSLWPDVCFFNAFGPAETSDDATIALLGPDTGQAGKGVPIGTPQRNMSVHVLGRDLRPCADGLPGEIWIGSAGVGRGYAGDPRRTAAAFRPDPFSVIPGSRLYKSGDNGLRRRDGTLEFLRRGDRQVKLHGARIELTEVEAVLMSHPDVTLARAECSGAGVERRLVAWAQTSVSSDVLRRFMAKQLPRRSVPAQIMTLSELPVTANGKVDTTCLLARIHVSEGKPDTGPAITALTPQEETVIGLFAQVLGRTHVGPEDDFFALGGHSLMAMRLIARARQVFARDIALAVLFDAPTPREFSARINEARLAVGDRFADPRPGRTGAVSPVAPGQLRLWKTITQHPGIALFNLPMAMRLRGALDADALAASFADLVKRHDMLASRFEVRNGKLVQIREPGFEFPLPVVDLSEAADAEGRAAAIAVEEAAWPFVPSEGPLFRAALLRLDEADHVLLITTNHLVADDQSLAIVFSDLAAAYAARCLGAPPLQPMSIRFADIAMWKTERLATAHGDVARDYWRRHLSDLSPRLDLPVVAQRQDLPSTRFRRIRRHLPPDLVDELAELARQKGVTLFLLGATAFGAMLGLRSGESDVRFATLLSTRNHPDTLSMVAPLIETVIIRAQMKKEQSAERFLGSVQRAVVGAMSHVDLPIEQVVAASAPDRDLIASPLCQALLVFQRGANLSPESAGTFDETGLCVTAFPPEPAIDTKTEQDEFEITNFEIICDLEVSNVGFSLVLRYNADLFDLVLAQSMCDDIENALRTMVADIKSPVGHLLDAPANVGAP